MFNSLVVKNELVSAFNCLVVCGNTGVAAMDHNPKFASLDTIHSADLLVKFTMPLLNMISSASNRLYSSKNQKSDNNISHKARY